MWKVKDKVKRSALISDIEDGGLKAPHLITKEYFAARNWQMINRESLKTCISTGDTPFNLRDEVKLSLSSQIVLLEKAYS